MIPLFHDFDGATVLVVGGGPVGARKAHRFAREADVVVVAPAFADADFGGAERVRAEPAADPEEATDWVERTDPALVVTATDDTDVNEAFASAARDAGALVNRADHAEDREGPMDVVVPATVREDPVIAAVATGGASPALSKYLRERLEDELDGAGAMAELTADLREELKAREIPTDERHEALRAVVRDPRVWKSLRTGKPNGRQAADDVVGQVVGVEWP